MARSGNEVAKTYRSDYTRFSTGPYESGTHGGRFVNNYANDVGADYGKFEDAGVMPVGTRLAKDSFTVTPQGRVMAGPLFIMEKMPKGFREDSGDWRYTMVMPDGTVAGTTNGAGAQNVEFCIACHAAVGEDQDHLFFLPEEYRVQR